MPLPNSENPKKGKEFENKVASALRILYKKEFHTQAIPIGNPPKPHKFDLVSDDKSIVAECKNYSWTETGNIPSAKMAFLNQAVLYLSHISKEAKKIIVLRKDRHPKRKESLAEYYVRTYSYLLEEICIMEFDVDKMVLERQGKAEGAVH